MATGTCSVCQLHAESTFKIEGMDCREEVAMLERRFRNLRGLEGFSADLMGKRLHVKYDAAILTTSVIAGAVADAGMRAWLEHEEPVASSGRAERWRRTLVWTSGVALGIALVASAAGAPRPVPLALNLISTAAGVAAIWRRVWHSIHARVLDINVLMLVAVVGAVVLQQYAESAAVIFLFAVAQALEARTMERARTAIASMLELTPSAVLIRDSSGERLVDVELVAIGARMIVRPGEKIALDGQIVAGFSSVNQAPVTGESMPADKAPGDEVFAGTINGRGALEVIVTRARRDTTLARIIHLVERAQAQRAPSQAFVERFASVYTPVVIVLAIGIAFIPPLVAAAAWDVWIYRALVLLVVSCPCALVISTPVSVVAALAGAARKGVLIKGGVHLERTARVRCVAFDKTGTLTHGRPEVVGVETTNGAGRDTVISLAAAIEHRSEHPIARAILSYARQNGISVHPGRDVRALEGRGAEGHVDGATVVVGNHRLFHERSLCTPRLESDLADLAAHGRTAVLVGRNDVPLGLIAIADRPRETSRDAIDLLRDHGIARVVLLTGDSRGTAQAIADELGIDEARAELLPEDKVQAVRELRHRYGAVAMVGDGINDAPALAAADVGIAMGVAGSSAALETADVALMADELQKIPYAVRLSRATLRTIKANLGISLVMKAAFVVLAIGGLATLWMSVVADTGASVIVIVNAMRLLRAD